ncbi:acyl-CoA reductase [Runella sp.]|uniref:acyl-CoA reductase n=1 Tax=Runella sp. TaxID=1960881 RepID=UPI003D0FA2D9
MDNSTKHIAPFVELGKMLTPNVVEEIAFKAYLQNHWFTPEFVTKALNAIKEEYLSEEKLKTWVGNYQVQSAHPDFVSKKVGVVMAGNIPAVGFHDLLSVLISGHHLLAKLSNDDRVLMLFLIEKLIQIEPTLAQRITLVERLNAADAYIATGSDNTARYFEYYFSKKPHLIRRNRTSVGILTGEETNDELEALGRDVFSYFGLGCRNVSKVFVPKGYDFSSFYESIESQLDVFRNHHKYFNNYEYNKSIYLVNREPHLDNGFLILRETDALVSPISVLFFEYYESVADLTSKLEASSEKIQCIVSKDGHYPSSLPLGDAQKPTLFDYADGVDTMAFLTGL